MLSYGFVIYIQRAGFYIVMSYQVGRVRTAATVGDRTAVSDTVERSCVVSRSDTRVL